ncbi:MAG: lipid IV(A) 3-deoxy-D-manno-octulosonic acid transferase [Candidatus Protistobacter heckmanni]|nr:lipid IV(A) 3-deoxy-D-manno-octulosonic acid transferase [Candidatus Protistobacter heckmanni]
MLYAIYRAGWWLALPVALLRLLWRSRQERGYREHVAERLGCYPAASAPRAGGECLWVHAVSVGETRAAEPLVRGLAQRHPQATILLTHMTPTGRRTGAEAYADLIAQGRLTQAYLPYDLPILLRRMLRHFRPRLGLVMETEVWPAMIAVCKAQGVKRMLANARMSERSKRRAQRFGAATRTVFGGFDQVLAQTEADAARLRELGAQRVSVTGNLKFDVALKPELSARGEALKQAIGARLVVCAASTRQGEETLILSAWSKVLAHLKRAAPTQENPPPSAPLLLLVPRHPQRFDEAASLTQSAGFALARRSDLGADFAAQAQRLAQTEVLLGDSMGEMAMYYAACDIALIGGSLLPLGGQNLIEACASGKPVLLGPHMFNFAQASADALACGAALRTDAESLEATLFHLLGDAAQRARMGEAGLAFAQAHRGAALRMLQAAGAPY